MHRDTDTEIEAVPESLALVVDRLTAAGYRDDLVADATGHLVGADGRTYDPTTLIVDQTLRFEITTDPDDEAIVFALRFPTDGMMGTYTVPFGPRMPAHDAAVAIKLRPR